MNTRGYEKESTCKWSPDVQGKGDEVEVMITIGCWALRSSCFSNAYKMSYCN